MVLYFLFILLISKKYVETFTGPGKVRVHRRVDKKTVHKHVEQINM